MHEEFVFNFVTTDIVTILLSPHDGVVAERMYSEIQVGIVQVGKKFQKTMSCQDF